MKVAGIIDSDFRSGVKNGKPWKLMKVELEDGTTATGFDVVETGDEVEVTKNDYGFQYKAQKKQASAANDNVSKVLNLMYAMVKENNEMLKQLTGNNETFPEGFGND